MASPISRACGQAVVEVTIAAVMSLLVITSAVALMATLRKELKHNFIKVEPLREGVNAPQEIEELKKLVRFFPKESREETLRTLRQEGWEEDRRVKIPNGLIVLFKGPEGKLGFIEKQGRKLGVFYK